MPRKLATQQHNASSGEKIRAESKAEVEQPRQARADVADEIGRVRIGADTS